jgi:thiol:disulfide interchange protein DsbD
VIAAASAFAAFKVDLTRYDSPEADAWRRRYGIHGVPTVVFLTPGGPAGGVEVAAARVEGFITPERFLERMRLATAARGGAQAGD